MTTVIRTPNGGSFTLAPPPKRTSPAKLSAMQEAIERKRVGDVVRRNKKQIAKEESRARGAAKRARAKTKRDLSSDPSSASSAAASASSAAPAPTAAPVELNHLGLTHEAYADALDQLRSWRKVNMDLIDALSDDRYDALENFFWRAARGETTWTAFRLEVKNQRIETLPPRSSETQRAEALEAERRHRRLYGGYMSGGF